MIRSLWICHHILMKDKCNIRHQYLESVLDIKTLYRFPIHMNIQRLICWTIDIIDRYRGLIDWISHCILCTLETESKSIIPSIRGRYSVPWSNCISTNTVSEGSSRKSEGGAVMMYRLEDVSLALLQSLSLQWSALSWWQQCVLRLMGNVFWKVKFWCIHEVGKW